MKTEPFHPSTILCPLDFSDLSDLALKYAAVGARAFGARLVAVHAERFVLPPYFTSGQVEELTRQHRGEKARASEFLRVHVRKVLGKEADDLRIHFEVVDAHPVDAVLDAAKRHRADLIVMGTHGRGGAKRIWLGSVTENVVRQAGVPVFVVRQKQHEFIDPSGPQTVPTLRSILCPVNFSPAARSSIEHAASIAQHFNAQLVAACIAEPTDSRDFAEIKQQVSSWLNEANRTQCSLPTLVEKGHAGERIASLALESKADMIVLGAQKAEPSHAWRWGDTTEFVLRNAPVPVLVVPPKRDS